jgi:hypothetical protein
LSQSLLAAGCRHGSVDFQQIGAPEFARLAPDDISSAKARAIFKSFAPEANSHISRADFYAAFTRLHLGTSE